MEISNFSVLRSRSEQEGCASVQNPAAYEVLNAGQMDGRPRFELVFQKEVVVKDVSDLRRSYRSQAATNQNRRRAGS